MVRPVEQSQFEELLHLTRGSLVNTGIALYPELFSIKASPLHHKLSDALVLSERSTALAFPREFGKSTFMWEGMSSWNVLHRRYRYPMYIASTATIAEDALSNVKASIESHPILNRIINVVKSTKNQFFYKIGNEPYYIACYGAGQQLRGKRFERFRPDLVIMDDLETTEEVRSEDQRKKLKDWFYADVIPLGKEARFFYVGTMLHEACLLAELINKPLEEHRTGQPWATFRYGVLDDLTGEPTWPEKYDMSWIDMTRKKYVQNGMLYRFNTEYMNVAVGRDDRILDPERVRFYNTEQYNVARNGGMDVLITVDPGIHADSDHDPTCITTTGMDNNGQIWVMNVVRKHMVHHEILNAIVAEYRRWNPRRLYIESVQAQYYLLQDLEFGSWPGGTIIPVEKIDGKQVRLGKMRIHGLESLFEQKKLLIPAGAPWQDDLFIEIATFPRGKTDDILDTIAYAKLNHVIPRATPIDYEAQMRRPSSTVF